MPAVAALEQEVFGVDAWSAAAVAEELTGPRRRAVVAEEDGQVVGYAVTLAGDGMLDLQRIAVRPEHRRAGVASRLLEAVLQGTTADRMLLEVSSANHAALAFYGAHGFVQIDRRPRYYRDGSDALVLRRALGPACGGGA